MEGLDKAGHTTWDAWDAEDETKYRIESALPIYLFDHGYDVWINGNRGTFYNRGSILDDAEFSFSNDDEFWEYDWYTMATQDQPALIRYITGATEQD